MTLLRVKVWCNECGEEHFQESVCCICKNAERYITAHELAEERANFEDSVEKVHKKKRSY